MDSAKIFALGLAAGLAIHVFVRNSGKNAQKQAVGTDNGNNDGSIAAKSSSSKNKSKDTPASAAAAALAPVVQQPNEEQKPAKEEQPAPASTSAKKNKKNKKQAAAAAAAAAAPSSDSYAEVASEPPAINNDTVRARADAAQTAFTASLGDMRDADVDPLPAGYNSVATILAPEIAAPKPKLSKKDVDEGWSSVGGTFPSSSSAKANATSVSTKANGSSSVSIASTNPFAALPDDATTSSVRRIAAKPASAVSAAKANGWTVAGHGPVKSRPNGAAGVPGAAAAAETKKQRSNANKAQAKKAAKEEADRLQAERLANHRRQQAAEAAKQREVANRPAPKSVPGSSKVPTAKASVDLNGRLVWD